MSFSVCVSVSVSLSLPETLLPILLPWELLLDLIYLLSFAQSSRIMANLLPGLVCLTQEIHHHSLASPLKDGLPP